MDEDDFGESCGEGEEGNKDGGYCFYFLVKVIGFVCLLWKVC